MASPKNSNAGFRRATKVTLVYAVVGAAWILLSDAAVEVLPTGVTTRALQSMKGLLFVAVTSLALFTTLKRVFAALEARNSDLREKHQQLEVTLRELHHRVKNNLQLMNSIFALQARRETTEDGRHTLFRAQQRVLSIALVHELAYQEGNLYSVAMDRFVPELVAHLPESEGSDPRPAPRLAVENFTLEVRLAVPFGIILQELITNARTHGTRKEDEREMEISLTKSDREVTLVVTNSGSVTSDDAANSEGTGYTIVRTLVEQIDGTLSVDRSEGTRVTVRFPGVTKIVQNPPSSAGRSSA